MSETIEQRRVRLMAELAETEAAVAGAVSDPVLGTWTPYPGDQPGAPGAFEAPEGCDYVQWAASAAQRLHAADVSGLVTVSWFPGGGGDLYIEAKVQIERGNLPKIITAPEGT